MGLLCDNWKLIYITVCGDPLWEAGAISIPTYLSGVAYIEPRVHIPDFDYSPNKGAYKYLKLQKFVQKCLENYIVPMFVLIKI